ncbi:hypothetical protein EVAR_14834_1 [Eumeta japonica]|uniref:Uncharacterized protein n=1 Tax=Eumeta variegata TaxID=151549 RepID=A0A4C1V2V3_EUMVA|nr:hypothetical protein EVAR_14834_1 [Eumeta japonica]
MKLRSFIILDMKTPTFNGRRDAMLKCFFKNISVRRQRADSVSCRGTTLFYDLILMNELGPKICTLAHAEWELSRPLTPKERQRLEQTTALRPKQEI